MNRKYRIIPMTLYTAILILMDQISKYIIVKTMNIGESIPVIGDVLQITSHRNYGAAWGMLQNQMIFFYIITIIVLIALIYFYYKEAADNLLMQCGLMLILQVQSETLSTDYLEGMSLILSIRRLLTMTFRYLMLRIVV